MISISCTNCKTLLTIDDAFAGGVCRCQHCGTIQTVPARVREGSSSSGAVAQAAATIGKSKTLYQARTRSGGPAPSGTGLDQLAEIIASSGLSSGNLTAARKSAVQSSPPAPKAQGNRVIIAAAAVIILALVVVIVLLMRNKAPDTSASNTPAPTGGQTVAPSNANVPNPGVSRVNPKNGQNPTPNSQTPAVATPSKPSFVGLDLSSAASVVYILDRGTATRDSLDDLRAATIRSIQSLGPGRKFQVMFWTDGGSPPTFPAALQEATPENIDAVRASLGEIFAISTRTDFKTPFEKALAENPSVIILATGKGSQLDDSFVKTALDLRKAKNSSAKIYTFSIGSPGDGKLLQTLAEKTGGQVVELSAGELHGLTQ